MIFHISAMLVILEFKLQLSDAGSLAVEYYV